MMLLGFDATTIRGNKTGVGYYSSRLLERLTRIDGEDNAIDELLVLSNHPVSAPPIPRCRTIDEGRFPLRAVWMQGVLPFLLERLRPDLCHFTNFLAPYFTETPYVVTFHDMTLQLLPEHHTWRKRLLTATLAPAIARNARMIITPSRSAREDLARLLGISRNKIHAIPHAADPRFRPRKDAESWKRIEACYRLRKPYLLYVGTLEPRKNLGRAVAAFARLGKSFREHRFYLAGDLGWQSETLLRAIDSLSLSERVHRLGYVDEEDLPALYSHAELFVYPSLYEGFGFPVVEAMACGVPVLTSNTSSLSEIASGAALLVDPEDVEEMTEAMERGLSDAASRDRFIESGRARARSFSWERTTRETLAVYEQALERTSLRARAVGAKTESRDARAVVDTVAYGAFFDYPMKAPEIHRALLGVPLSERELRRLLDDNRLVRANVDFEPPFYFLKGKRHTIEARLGARRLTRDMLDKHRAVLELVRRTPYVRMVALSGATAYENARDEDIDLFLVTAKERTWAVALFLFVSMKLLGLRRTLCLNYLIAEDHLALPERDPFTASQILGLRPLAGKGVYYRFVRANAWGARFFPNFWRHFRGLEPLRDDEPEAGSSFWEALLLPGVGALMEKTSRLVLGRYLRRRLRHAGSPSSVKLEPGRLKLHFRDHGSDLARRIECMLNRDVTDDGDPGRESMPEARHVGTA